MRGKVRGKVRGVRGKQKQQETIHKKGGKEGRVRGKGGGERKVLRGKKSVTLRFERNGKNTIGKKGDFFFFFVSVVFLFFFFELVIH